MLTDGFDIGLLEVRCKLLTGGRYVAPQAWASTSALLGAVLVLAARVKLAGWTVKAKC